MAIITVHRLLSNPDMHVHLLFFLTFSIYVKLLILLPFITFKDEGNMQSMHRINKIKKREGKHKSFEFRFYAACQNRMKIKVIAVH